MSPRFIWHSRTPWGGFPSCVHRRHRAGDRTGRVAVRLLSPSPAGCPPARGSLCRSGHGSGWPCGAARERRALHHRRRAPAPQRRTDHWEPGGRVHRTTGAYFREHARSPRGPHHRSRRLSSKRDYFRERTGPSAPRPEALLVRRPGSRSRGAPGRDQGRFCLRSGLSASEPGTGMAVRLRRRGWELGRWAATARADGPTLGESAGGSAPTDARVGHEAIDGFQNAVLDHRNDIDAWFGLGESLFHYGGWNGQSPRTHVPALERVASWTARSPRSTTTWWTSRFWRVTRPAPLSTSTGCPRTRRRRCAGSRSS